LVIGSIHRDKPNDRSISVDLFRLRAFTYLKTGTTAEREENLFLLKVHTAVIIKGNAENQPDTVSLANGRLIYQGMGKAAPGGNTNLVSMVQFCGVHEYFTPS